MKAGKAADAQRVILDSLARTTKGAADASQGPYKRALSVLADVTEDAQRALAEGFLPVLERVAKWLSKSLADPKVIADIRGMGKSLAGAFDDAVTFAQKVPWGAIKDGLKTAAEWAGRLFDAFRSMPPEMQATIVALAGLNKLSGGAISGIVGELGKGLIKGVLGMTAGVVNLNAGVVNGGGGRPGKGGGGPGLRQWRVVWAQRRWPSSHPRASLPSERRYPAPCSTASRPWWRTSTASRSPRLASTRPRPVTPASRHSAS